ncbi:hypothetical protein YA0089_26630 [Pseudomonas viridiflava]|uniref:hypothetical protein n=1 Tax=Pseudomonas viridiflava TaxID=33069 RepID=UPI0018E64794|nr:hypothetical protein [Pseudomonas viridiflava]MBI6727194.1 hypothetical protein [Pseudomonas viridiflava]
MMHKSVRVALVAVFVMHMAGCASPSPEQAITAEQQKFIDAMEIAPQGPVELTVGYCNSQQEFTARKRVVPLGEVAIFEPTDTAIYELKIRPIKTTDGKIVMSMTAQWQEKIERRDVLFSRQVLTQDGEISPQSVLKINGHDSCFTVTARSVSQEAH